MKTLVEICKEKVEELRNERSKYQEAKQNERESEEENRKAGYTYLSIAKHIDAADKMYAQEKHFRKVVVKIAGFFDIKLGKSLDGDLKYNILRVAAYVEEYAEMFIKEIEYAQKRQHDWAC